MEERLGRLWQLTMRAWTFAGRPIARISRGDWPVERFEIEHGRRGAAGRLLKDLDDVDWLERHPPEEEPGA